ncbi:MAG: hypothetical protein ACTSPD_11330 [Promethearchaeota archaeon]
MFYNGRNKRRENKIKEIKEQETKSIWISQKKGQPQLFYEWKGTYFKQLYSSKNVKYLIYLNKSNKDLRKKFDNLEDKINDLVNKI